MCGNLQGLRWGGFPKELKGSLLWVHHWVSSRVWSRVSCRRPSLYHEGQTAHCERAAFRESMQG